MEDVLNHAIRKCPFLHELSQRQGAEYAARIAVRPTEPASQCPARRRPLLEDLDSFDATLRAFHGPEGLVPLRGCPFARSACPQPSAAETPSRVAATAPAPPSCPRHAPQPERLQRAGINALPPRRAVSTGSLNPATALPMATMSLSFGRNIVSKRQGSCHGCREMWGLHSLGSS
jgi:hypothetical protein